MINRHDNRVLVILGPTASGKSSLALEVAKLYGGEIISADSMQIYKYLDIGTAKLPPEKREGILHHLIDIIDPDKSFSVAQYKTLAKEAIDDIISRGKLPIVCGGTGLYINSLIYNYDFFNTAPNSELRRRLNDICLRNDGPKELYQMLINLEPDSNIHPNNVKRVIRRLEVLMSADADGEVDARTYDRVLSHSRIDGDSDNRTVPHNTISDEPAVSNEATIISDNVDTSVYTYELIGLSPQREYLYEKIDKRVNMMFESGLMQEFNQVVARFKLTQHHQSMSAIGYRELFLDLDIDQIVDKVKQDSRNYAKRQITWFKKIPGVRWYPDISEALSDIETNKIII